VVKLEAIVPQERVEELVWRHAKPLLIESRKRHHVSYRRYGERGVLRHLTSLKLHRRHKPMLHEFLQMVQHNGGRSPVLLHRGSRGREGQRLQDPGIPSYYPFSLSFSPFFRPLFSFLSRHREGGKERTAGGAQGHRGAKGRPPALNPTASVVKQLSPLKRSKGSGKLSLPASPTPRTSCQ
jgi:hypothetical protein